MAGIGIVQAQSLERAKVLEGIGADLKEELDTLSGFVDNVADRRPRGNKSLCINKI